MSIDQEYTEDIQILTIKGKKVGNYTYNPPKAPPLQDKRFHAYVKAVYYLLVVKEFLDKGLAMLEAAMVNQIGGSEQIQGAQSYFSTRAQGGSIQNEQYKGILSSVLFNSQINGGFKTDRKVTIAPWLLPSDLQNIRAFAEQQKLGEHFKDVNAGSAHGEFTHQIQWYLLSEQWDNVNTLAGWLHKDIDVAGTAMTDEPYSTPAQFMRDVGKTGMSGVGLWPMLFDRVADRFNGVYAVTTDNEIAIDGRCPERLHSYLLRIDNAFPLLRAFLKARKAKRERQTDDRSYEDYLPNKLKKTSNNSPVFQQINDIGYIFK